MGEGWSDYIACTINNVIVVGNWVLNNPAGIRGFPYDSQLPGRVRQALGTGRYTEVHNIGEIWCATLMEMNRRTDRYLAAAAGHRCAEADAGQSQLPQRARRHHHRARPRAAGGSARRQPAADGAWQGIWAAFAEFGMGPRPRPTARSSTASSPTTPSARTTGAGATSARACSSAAIPARTARRAARTARPAAATTTS